MTKLYEWLHEDGEFTATVVRSNFYLELRVYRDEDNAPSMWQWGIDDGNIVRACSLSKYKTAKEARNAAADALADID